MLLRSCFSKHNKGKRLQRDHTIFSANIESIKKEWQYYLWQWSSSDERPDSSLVRNKSWIMRQIHTCCNYWERMNLDLYIENRGERLDYGHTFTSDLKGGLGKQQLRTVQCFNWSILDQCRSRVHSTMTLFASCTNTEQAQVFITKYLSRQT